MWEISNSLQIIGFLRAVILGGGFCVFYDFLRALRRSGFNSDFAVFIQDILYFIILLPITFCFLLALTNGELRAYFFVGIAVGFLVIRISVSKLVLKIFVLIFSVLKKIYSVCKKMINKIFSYISVFTGKIYLFFKEISVKTINCFKKLLKNR